MEALAASFETALAAVSASGADAADPFVAEVRDGLAIDAARARFAAALYGAAAADDASALAKADPYLDAARAVVARRHSALHDPDPASLLTRGRNPTLYPYGYLFEADTLCYWERERAQAAAALGVATAEAPPCFEL